MLGPHSGAVPVPALGTRSFVHRIVGSHSGSLPLPPALVPLPLVPAGVPPRLPPPILLGRPTACLLQPGAKGDSSMSGFD